MKRNIITDKDGDILEAHTTPSNVHDSKPAYSLMALPDIAFPWIRRPTPTVDIEAVSLKN